MGPNLSAAASFSLAPAVLFPDALLCAAKYGDSALKALRNRSPTGPSPSSTDAATLFAAFTPYHAL